MKKMKLFPICFAVLIMFIFAVPVNAADLNRSTCGTYGFWNAKNNTCTVSTRQMISTVLNIPAGVTLKITSNGTIENGGTLDYLQYFYGTINNYGTVSVDKGGHFNNNGFYGDMSGIFYSGGFFNNYGTFNNNNGTFFSHGYFNNYVTFNNNVGNIDNVGSFYNVGTLNNNVGTIGNSYWDRWGGVIINQGVLNNIRGQIRNGNTFFNGGQNIGGIINNIGGTITTQSPSYIYNGGYSHGNGTITNSCGGTIIGTVRNGDPVEGVCIPPFLNSINVMPNSINLVVGETQTFAASPKDQYGDSISATVTWSSSNETVGTVNSNTGDFTALVAGTTMINATNGSVTGTAIVFVIPTYNISGYVFDNYLAGQGGVLVQNGSNTAITAASGYYSITGLLSGTYNFSYSKAGFNSSYLEITISGTDVLNANKTIYDNMPPASVKDLVNVSYAANYINWTWTEPSDPDFAKVMVYLDGVYRNDTLKGVNY